ncbi:hypothetical protein [Micromonospora sp. B9E7]
MDGLADRSHRPHAHRRRPVRRSKRRSVNCGVGIAA